MLLVLDKNKKISLFFSRIIYSPLYKCFFSHKIDGSFYSIIESNGLVEIQEYIYINSSELS